MGRHYSKGLSPVPREQQRGVVFPVMAVVWSRTVAISWAIYLAPLSNCQQAQSQGYWFQDTAARNRCWYCQNQHIAVRFGWEREREEKKERSLILLQVVLKEISSFSHYCNILTLKSFFPHLVLKNKFNMLVIFISWHLLWLFKDNAFYRINLQFYNRKYSCLTSFAELALCF